MNDSLSLRIFKKAVLYVGLAVAFLAFIGVIIFITRTTGFTIPFRWVGLVLFTGVLAWVIFSQFRYLTRKPRFWPAVCAIFAVHFVVLTGLLWYLPDWRLIWFIPVVFIEVAATSVVMEKVVSINP